MYSGVLLVITVGVQDHSIYARNQPLGGAAIVLVIGSKSLAERDLLNMNAIQHSQSRGNEDNGKTGPGARVQGEGQENDFQAEIGRMANKGIKSASLQLLS